MTEDEIKARAKAAGEKLAMAYSKVALPKQFIPSVAQHLARCGIELSLADDGEDEDGMVTWVAVPSSAILTQQIMITRFKYRGAMGLFLFFAAVLLCSIVYSLEFTTVVSVIGLILNAAASIRDHRAYERFQKLHYHLVSKGF